MTRPTGQPRAQNALEVAAQIEDCELSVLPPQLTMHPVRPAGQPEALLGTAGGLCARGSQGIRRACFQREQLARDYLTIIREARTRDPVLLVILGSPPPVTAERPFVRLPELGR